MNILEISGQGEYESLVKAIDNSGLLKGKCFSSADTKLGTVQFTIEATQDTEKDAIEELLKANGMTIETSEMKEESGGVFVDPDSYDD